MQVGILGPLTVEVGDRTVPIAGARLRALITRLALDTPRVVPADELVDDLWADEPPADRANALQSLVSRARRTLGTGSVPAVGAGYRLAVDGDAIDLHRFTTLARTGSELVGSDPGGARELLDEALELWRGDPLTDAKDAEYARGPIVRLWDRRLDVLADRLACSVALGEATAVVSEAQELAAANPLAERLTALHIRALAAAGRPAEALAVYQRTREYLADTLGADPSAELQQLHLQLLRGETGHAEPVQPPPPARDNLPASITSFLGRDTELARVAELLEQSRLVTVIGPGGVGKTRLALEIATRRRSETPDGVWLVSLAAVTDPAAVAPAFLDALRLRGEPTMERREIGSRDVAERLLSGLGQVQALIVVDNCEHLINEVADLVGAITEQCPQLRIIATSREPLGVLGESLCPVPPLALPRDVSTVEQARATPAVQLLEERATAVRADFVVDEKSLPAVLEIVGRLDGLPLAIELAAARLRLLPPAEVAALLSDRFRLLTGGNRAALPRHRTLWAVVDWSWNLLERRESQVAERMSAFTGPWSVPAAAAVCADLQLDSSAIRDILLSLADKSLVDTGDGVHFRMLETIREFAVVRCTESGSLDTARQAHAHYYQQLVHRLTPRLRGKGQLPAVSQLQAEHVGIVDTIRYLTDAGELTRARTMVAELIWFWIITDRGPDVAGQVAALLPREPSDDPLVVQVEVFHLLSELAAGLPAEDFGSQRAEAIALAKRITATGPHRGVLAVMEVLLNFFAGENTRAAELADEVVRTSTSRWVRGATQMMQAAFAENVGDLDQVRRRLDAAHVELAGHPDRWARSAIAALRGRIRTIDGDIDGAIADLEEAFAVAVEMRGMDDEMQSRMMLSQLYARRGDFPAAHRQLDQMLARRLEYGQRSPATRERWETAILMSRLLVHDIAGEDELVRPLRDELQRLLTAAVRTDGHLIAVGWAVLGTSFARTGDVERALAAVRRAYPVAIATEDHPVMAVVGEAVAEVVARAGSMLVAVELIGAAGRLRGALEIGNPTVERITAHARKVLGDTEFDLALQRGLAMSREQALQRLDPATLDIQVAGSSAQPDRIDQTRR